MTPRTFWDRFGALWDEPSPGRLRLIWDDEMPAAVERGGWTLDPEVWPERSVPRAMVERLGYGPLVASC